MSKKGAYYEYKVMEIFEDYGYAGIRTLGSGGGTKKPKPDIVVSNGTHTYGIEVKKRNSNVVYIKLNQVIELKEFCRLFGATPVIVVKLGKCPFYMIPVESLELCKKNYRIGLQDLKNGVDLENFLFEEYISGCGMNV